MKNNSTVHKSKTNKTIVARKALVIVSQIITALLLLTMLSGCECKHKWIEATCTSPQKCEKCGETNGSSLEHEWVEATCTEQKHCSICGTKTGEKLEHTPSEWTVTKPVSCTAAGEQKSTCSVCGENFTQTIPALNPSGSGHTPGEWTEVNATCTKSGSKQAVCTVCSETITEEIPPTGHSLVDDKIKTLAGLNNRGEKTQKCTKCGETIEMSFDLTSQEKANIYVVQDGTFNKYPNVTVNTAFSSYFANSKWAASGNLVFFAGDCTWYGNPAKAAIAFEVTNSGFSVVQIEIDDNVFKNTLDINSILEAIYSNY